MNGRANTRMVVKLAERKTEMIGFNGSYNLIDIHNRRYLYDSAKSFGRIKHFFLLDSATGRIIHFFLLDSATGRIIQFQNIVFGHQIIFFIFSATFFF